MRFKKAKISVISLFLFAACAVGFFIFSQQVLALGISPPWVINNQLLKGSHFEKTVYITQGTPEEPLRATAEINLPEKIRSWVTIKQGREFTIPLVKLFPVTIYVDVPQNAELGDYNGEIRITTQPETKGGASVSIGVGVAIELDFAVVEKEVIDFTVQNLRFLPMEESWPVKIAFIIDNRGNTRVRPSRVFLEIYDKLEKELLGSVEDKDLTYVEPFQGGESIAEFPVNLAVGVYFGKVKVYKTEEEVVEFKFPFEVLEKGTLPREKPWLKWLLVGVGLGILVAGLIWSWRKSNGKILMVFSGIIRPFIKIKKKFKKISKILKEKEE